LSSFTEGWEKDEEKGGGRGFGSLVRSQQPVKPQIDRAGREIAVLIAKLDQAQARIKSRDEVIFHDVVSAIARGDRDHAAVFANELSAIRRVGAAVTSAKLALEQVSLRLGTITDLGDITAILAPTVAVVKGVGQGLGSVMPSANGELDEISGLLSSTLVEAGAVGGSSLNFKAANGEAEQVLEEAAAAAQRRMAAEFPEVPAITERKEDEEGLAV
jgi:division protein CdvB (Snf7/Vps24/ESCRT-III family)